ncbi:SH3 domain-containing protein [Turneriella parva]|uniref:SH3 type 3 domain protein n=1 Tax=Turneriella parva (strain ATCC BAA-1111 / DSM 21527 / NCTC 11395 / H) TaxID=869212 RepID=I4BA37_TURPD|nr:SH3 domain-containing protein [Turneriella parva]AFM14144.1 SH3 type 3 domain protein [Turneriella parva DSM 21527]
MRLLTIIFSVILILNCKKSGGIQPTAELPNPKKASNEIYYTLPKNGTNLRSEPNVNSAIKALLPQNTKVNFVDMGDFAEIENQKDRWFEVEHNGTRGWIFGSLLSVLPSSANLNAFIGGCLRDGCETCDAIRFIPGGKVHMALECHFGSAKGVWKIENNSITADVTILPGCYDSCLAPEENPGFVNDKRPDAYERASQAFVDRNRHNLKLRFTQQSDGSFDYEILSSDRKPEQAEYIPPRPLGRMRHYAVTK